MFTSPGSDQTLAELIQAGGKPLLFEIHRDFKPISNKKEARDQWKGSIIAPVYTFGDEPTIVSIVGYRCYHFRSKLQNYQMYRSQDLVHI